MQVGRPSLAATCPSARPTASDRPNEPCRSAPNSARGGRPQTNRSAGESDCPVASSSAGRLSRGRWDPSRADRPRSPRPACDRPALDRASDRARRTRPPPGELRSKLVEAVWQRRLPELALGLLALSGDGICQLSLVRGVHLLEELILLPPLDELCKKVRRGKSARSAETRKGEAGLRMHSNRRSRCHSHKCIHVRIRAGYIDCAGSWPSARPQAAAITSSSIASDGRHSTRARAAASSSRSRSPRSQAFAKHSRSSAASITSARSISVRDGDVVRSPPTMQTSSGWSSGT